MKKITILIFIFTTYLFVGCNSVDLEDTDPNNFSDAKDELLLKQPFLAMDLVVEGELARLSGIWSSYFTGSDRQYISYNSYNVVAGDFNNIWGTFYADGIAQARLARSKAEKVNNAEIQAISLIVEANLLGIGTSLWGDIPNKQAANVDEYPQPIYDGQIDVYNDAIYKLKKAISIIEKNNLVSSNNYASEVIDVESLNWVEISNSLIARYYLHMGEYDKALERAKKGISSANGSFMFKHPGSSYPNNISGAQNIYFDFCAWNRDGYMGAGDAYLVKLLNERSDVRVDWYYFPPGYWNSNWYPASWTGGIFDAGESFPIITYYETQLIIAECELLGSKSDAGKALTSLNSVRTYWNSKMNSINKTTGEKYFSNYINTDFSTKSDLLKEILTEKYISCYGQIEGFNDIRRTDNYLKIPLKTGTKFPERMLIPQSEINSNKNAKLIDVFVPTSVNEKSYSGI